MHTTSAHPFQNYKDVYHKAEQMVNNQRTTEEIKEELLKREDITDPELEQIIKYLKKLRHDKHHQMGRVLILTGAVFLLAGFVITFLNISKNQSVHFAMYGLTSLGLLIMFAGLYYVFN